MTSIHQQLGWKKTTLGMISNIQTGPFGSQLHKSDYVTVGTPIITVEHLLNDRISHDIDIPKVSVEDVERLRTKYSITEGDIVFSRVGSVDRSAYVSKSEEGWLFSGRLLRVRPNTKIVKGRWLDYSLRQEKTKEFVRRIAVGATMPSINTSLLGLVPVLLPSLGEQQAIAAVLSSLDEKIELLRNENKTLESIAQQLFQEWFVSKDWDKKKIQDIAEVTIGRTPPRKESKWFSTNSRDRKWISIRDMGNSGSYISDTSEYLTPEAIEKFRVPLIPKNTVVLSFKLTVGRVAITTEDMFSNEAIAHIRLPKNSKFFPEFMYLFFKQFNFSNLGSTSSIAMAVNSQTIKEIEVYDPDIESMEAFLSVVKPIFKKIKKNSSQVQILSTLRGSLLPQMMSGEVKVLTT